MDSQIEEIKSRLDIVEVVGGYIRLQKAGANWRAVCPFHNEKTPSFTVSPARQIWHCFGGCGEGGDIFSFVMKIEGVEFGDALRTLAQRAGVVLKKEDSRIKSERQKYYEIYQKAAEFFENNLRTDEEGKKAETYLRKRGLSQKTIKEFRVGYIGDSWDGLLKFLTNKKFSLADIGKTGLAVQSQKNNKWFDRFRGRIMFPIFDLNGQVIAFGGRIFSQKSENEAKYLNSSQTLIYDKSKVLYGLNFAKQEMRKSDKCVLVEGYMDLIMAYQDGVKNAAAVSGTALTTFQLSILKRYSENLVFAFDMDEAGQKASARGIDLARNFGFNIKVMTLPEGKDPADFVLSRPRQLPEFVENAKPIMEYYFEKVFGKIKPDSADNKKEIAKIILPQIKRITNKIEQAHWIGDLSLRLGIQEGAIIEEIKNTEINDNSEIAFRQPEEAVLNQKKQAVKTREEVMGDYLVGLFLKHSQHLNLANEFNFDFPQTADFASALKYFQNYKDSVDFKEIFADAPKNLSDYLNRMELESHNFEVKNPLAEIKVCVQNLKRFFLDRKMEELKIALARAEKNNVGEEIGKLADEFQKFSIERQSLEKIDKK